MNRFYRLALAYLLPAFLVFAVLWKGGKSLEATWILTGVAWLLTLAAYRVRGRGRALPTTLWCSLLLFFGWTLAAYLHSSTANYGLDEVLRDGSFILLLFWAVREAHETTVFVPRFLTALSWTVGISALIGIGVYTLQPVNRFVGTFFDFRFQTDYWPNAWGDFVLLTWPLLLWQLLIDRKTGTIVERRILLLRACGLGVFLGCFFLSYSRGSFLAFIAQAGLLLVLVLFFVIWPLMRQAKRPSVMLKHLFPPLKVRGAKATSALAVAVLALSLLFSFEGINVVRSTLFPVQSVVEKATFSAAEGTSSVDERAQFWHQAFVLSLEKPLLGWGPYSFRFVQPRLQEGVFATSDHPHNVFLKMALERGWPAAFLLAFIILFVLASGIAQLWNLRGRLRHSTTLLFGIHLPLWSHALLLICLLTAVTGTIAHSLIDYNLQFVGNGLLLWTEMGLILALSLSTERSIQPKYRGGMEVALASLLIIVAILEGRFLVTSSLGRHAETSGNSEAAIAWYARSGNERFSRDLHLSNTHLLMDAGLPDAALRALDAYFVVNKEDARAWLLKADIEKQKGDWEAALKSYEEAFRLGKYNYMDAVHGVILALFENGKFVSLNERLPTFEALLQEYATAIEHNIHFIALTPNVESLAETLDFLSEIKPEKKYFYQDMKTKVVQHAQEERSRLSSRTPGLLW